MLFRSETDLWAKYLEGFSYALVIVTALVLLIRESISFGKEMKEFKIQKNACIIDENSGTTIIPNLDTTNKPKNLIPFLISGAYPCPGAILVLVLSFTLNILPLGIFSVLAMSLGMALPIIGAGYLAWFGRVGLFSILKEKQNLTAIIAFVVETIGYLLLIGFSLYIGLPFFIGLLG